MSDDMNYGAYLKLNQLLSSQSPTSGKNSEPAHEEMFFIIIHQVYELWFKQILHELDSVRMMFGGNTVDEKSVGVAVSRLERIVEIQKLLIQQIEVLETMTPLDFLEFRGYLPGASGFQSIQFRMIENKLGLPAEARLQYAGRAYHAEYSAEDAERIKKTETEPSLFALVERWLERTPFLVHDAFDFLSVFGQAFDRITEKEKALIQSSISASAEEKAVRIRMSEQAREYVESILDRSRYEKFHEEGRVRLSYQAFVAALFINLYRDQPILHLPFKLLSTILDVDEHLNTWRHRHSLMVRRMIGAKIGTGGSSGHDYLSQTVQKHNIFSDLYMISTFYIPRSALPPLDAGTEKLLGFYFSSR